MWIKVFLVSLLVGVNGCVTKTTPEIQTSSERVVSPPSSEPEMHLGGVPKGWDQIWTEEFSLEGILNPKVWRYDTAYNKGGWFNNEAQYYSENRLKNVRVQNGHLIITADKEDLAMMPDWGGQKYSSARIDTKGKAEWRYGFYEIRAKLPCGLGTWPAIWMLGVGGEWPQDGEIDIMEHVGQKSGEVLGTIHNAIFFGANAKTGKINVANTCSDFHRYQVRWDRERITFGVDDINYYQYLNPRTGKATWPFDQDFYLILNLAIGGHLGGPIDDSIFPVSMDIDYIRIYQDPFGPGSSGLPVARGQ